jgi:hypothetical protein
MLNRWMVFVLSLCLAGVALGQSVPTPSPEDGAAFTAQTATNLLNQVREGLQGHMQKQMLDAFDLSHMSGGQSFKNQVTAFFDQNDSVRIHFHVREASMQDGKGITVVDMEMELEQNNSTAPPVRRKAQLRLVAENGGHGWKFTDVQPRTFFY